VLVAGVIAVWRGGQGLRWRELAPGLEFAMLHGEPFCRRGSSAIAVLRLDPERVRLRVRHYTQNPEARPLDVVEWQRLTNSVAVFNAGQFYPDFRYLGLLASDGTWLYRRPHPGYQAVLVAGRRADGRGARVLDLSNHSNDPDSLPWSDVAQSFMLFDSSGTLRVRRSERIANRTVVAEDRHGRVLVLVSEGAYTLADLAHVLQQSSLHLRHAMSMDGGREAELVVAREAFRYASFGQWSSADEHPSSPVARVPLPTVISVELP
jgi:hypothetical protein